MTIANNYEIIKRLGQGGMGVVYLARDLALDKLVAVKMLSPQLAQDEKFLARFRLEARAQAKFDHPHIVRIHTFLEDQGNYFLVMEYVEGTTLDSLIHESPGGMSLEKAWPLLNQILSAFEYAHHLGIIHRDIKPKNILIETPGQRVKVADFGLARIDGQSGLTVTSTTGGTLAYMSPEQIENLTNVDYRTDIYSLGMTMYEMLTGHTPFLHEESDLNIRLAITRGKITHVRKANPALPRDLANIVMTALAPDADERYRSIGEMRRALSQVAAESLSRGNPQVQSIPSVKTPRRRGLKIFTALLMAAFTYLAIQAMTQPEAWWITALQKWVSKAPESKPAPLMPPPIKPPQKFSVYLQTTPAGVTADIDGRTWGQTPLRDSLAPGEHRLLLTKLNYHPLDTTLTVNAELYLQLTLRSKAVAIPKPIPQKLTLLVATNPTGATATLNDGQTITTRNFFKNLERKAYLLRVYKEGYQPVEKSVNPVDYENEAVVINLLPIAKRPPEPTAPAPITIDVRPFGTILIDGTIVATNHSGVYHTQAQPGLRQITIRHPQWRWMKSVSITAEGPNNFAIDFTKKVEVTVTAFDNIDTAVPNCTIIIDGAVQEARTPASFELNVGMHEITVARADYRLINSPPMPILLEADKPLKPLKFILQK